MTDRATEIRDACTRIADMLVSKNAAYGDSALSPLNVFGTAAGFPDSTAAIRVRIDDKLARIARGNAPGEDTVTDLIGYLVMLQLACKAAGTRPTPRRSRNEFTRA